MRTTTIRSDFTVVGGGLAGTFAAIAAAREGATVTLVQDRPVLGGNSSSEVRLWALGAPHSKTYTRYSREGGIAEELYLENLYRNPEGNPVLWDPLLIEYVTREPNIRLLLDTAAHDLELDEDGAIRSVKAFCSPAQTTFIIRSQVYLDASGDGILGFLAGGEFRIGREARDEFGESMAPDQPDRKMLGHSIYFFTKKSPQPVRFVRPEFAIDISKTNIPKFRRITSGAGGSHFWWIEYGGLLDTIYDHLEIKQHLWKIVYGIWDYIKNSGAFPKEEVDTLTLEWVGLIPGKRESRRFMGDYILTEPDVMSQREFPDAVAQGGWSLDLHPSEGIYSEEPPCIQVYSEGVYGIPYRSMYSKNVPNLLISGRIISASHVAFGSTRVMLTGGVMGQAAGTAAALCIEEGLEPRDFSKGAPLEVLRRRLLRNDQTIPGVANDDPDDLALSAKVSASTAAQLEGTREIDPGAVKLDKRRSIQIPVVSKLDTVSIKLNADEATSLEWSVWRNARRVNYVPTEEMRGGTVNVPYGDDQWIDVPVDVSLEGENCWVVFEPNEHIGFHTTADRVIGVMAAWDRGAPDDRNISSWPPEDWNHVFRITPAQDVWQPGNVVDGYSRQHILPHIWVSEPMSGSPEWVELAWDTEQTVSEVRVTTNTELNRVIYNVQHQYTERIIQQCLRDFSIQIPGSNGDWRTVAEVRGNHQRHVVIPLETVTTERLRVLCEATNGHDRCEIYEIRAYA